MLKDQDNLEYAISQYLDGTLGDFDRRVLEERLANDAEARLLASEHARLDALLKNSRVESAINFDKLAAHLSGKIEKEDDYVAQPMRLPGVWVRRLAIAAGVVLAIGMGLHFIPGTQSPSTDVVAGSINVSGPTVEKPMATPSVTIAVGPSNELKERGMAMGLVNDTIITSAPRVVITATGQPSAGDDRLY